jgi:hypothetical protein
VRTIIFSEWFMFNPNWPIFQLYHVENMFLVDQMKVMSALYWTVTHLSSIFSAISKKQVHRKTHTDSKPISLCSFSLMPSAKQTSNNDLFFVQGPGLGQAQACFRDKQQNEMPTFPSWYLDFLQQYNKKKTMKTLHTYASIQKDNTLSQKISHCCLSALH